MRALVFHGPDDLRVEQTPDPAPAEDEVLLQIVATGICGSDLHGYTGENGRRHPGQIMGHETVGRIAALGGAVAEHDGLTVGAAATVNPVIGCGTCRSCEAGTEQHCASRRVIGVDPTLNSAFAEFMAVPARNVVPLPPDMPLEHGALVEPLSVGYHAAVRGGVGAHDRVLVIGGGPIGQACALAARRLGASRVAVSELSEGRRALVEALGFAAVDPAAGEFAASVEGTLGGSATVVIDAVGGSASLAAAFAASERASRVVLVGMGAPEVSVAAYAISTDERSVIGSFCYTSEEFRRTAEWVAAGPAGLERLIDGRVAFEDGPGAFADLASGRLDVSKILVLT
ncbi:zinc-dependent alcohol dehydrogenase [Glycomyces arizonensis]|uniref:zinc-dependent alcohol dehydrogenase n=1 Tax=Glycomyces arizonensis TaxID=256035 RepID=UPI0003F5CBE5|nr:alcohol dehydrogenase catalytic domain-containing protein [Glycomyces arizonensis]